MKKLLVLAVCLAPAMLFAQSAFNGTWRAKGESAQFSGNDRFSLQNGRYQCDTCVPKIDVKADGQDHKVSGSPYFDSISVRVQNDHTVEIVNKKAGSIWGTTKMTASDDGKILTIEWTQQLNGQEATGKFTSTRVGAAPEGSVNRVSGVWHPEKVESASENVLTLNFKTTDDGLSMTQPFGSSYTAKFDGNEYPYKGDPGITSVSLKKIDANTIEETDKLKGKVVSITQMIVASDGKTMNLKFEDKLAGRTAEWVLEKQ